MEKCVIVYQSRTGFTEKYANWIAEELDCEAYPLRNVGLVHLDEYDLIVFGGGVRAGRIDGIKFINKIRKQFPNNKLVLFATGAAPQEDTAAVERVRSMNVPKNSGIPFFYFQSGINYENMKGFDKLVMSFVRKMMNQAKDKGGTQDEMMVSMKNSYDDSSKEFIGPLIDHIRTL